MGQFCLVTEKVTSLIAKKTVVVLQETQVVDRTMRTQVDYLTQLFPYMESVPHKHLLILFTVCVRARARAHVSLVTFT